MLKIMKREEVFSKKRLGSLLRSGLKLALKLIIGYSTKDEVRKSTVKDAGQAIASLRRKEIS